MERISFWAVATGLVGTALMAALFFGNNAGLFDGKRAGMDAAFSIVGLVLVAGTVFFLWKFRETDPIIFRIERQPIFATGELTDGITAAVSGKIAGAGRLLLSPYTNTSCVYFHSIKEKLVRTKNSSHWDVIENVSGNVPFLLEDGRGSVEVHLENVDSDFSHVGVAKDFSQPDYPNSEVDCKKALLMEEGSETIPFLGIFVIQREIRRTEYVLVPGLSAFVYGKTFRTADGKIGIREGKDVPLIVSQKSKEDYLKEFAGGEGFLHGSSLLLSAGATFLGWGLSFPWWAIGLANLAVFADLAVKIANRIIELDQRCKNAQSEIDIQLGRRADLLPRIAEAAKAVAKHEKELHLAVAGLRQQMVFSSSQKTFLEQPKRADIAILAVAEKYPKLRSNEAFARAMATLTDTENRIAHSRAFYNRSVLKYNSLVQQFPYSVLAGALGFGHRQFMSLEKM